MLIFAYAYPKPSLEEKLMEIDAEIVGKFYFIEVTDFKQ